MNAWPELAYTYSTCIQIPCGGVILVSREFNYFQIKGTMRYEVFSVENRNSIFSILFGREPPSTRIGGRKKEGDVLVDIE